ncbi:MAG: branched-chain amino acid ABC transporter permease [Pseudolabrys sp.]
MTRFGVRLAAVVAVLCLVLAPFVLNSFSITLLNYIGIYSLVAIGLALLTGVAGIVSFGQAAFVGIAAYSTAWASALNGLSPWAGLVIGAVLTCAVASVLGYVTLRLRGHYLSLSTIAWGLSIGLLFGNVGFLGGHNGISSVPPISFGPFVLDRAERMYFLIWAVVVVAVLLAYNLLDSRVGRALRTLRGGDVLVESLGISAFRIRLATFVIAALLAAVSGWLYAHLSRYVSPGPFGADMGIEYLMMTMIGGGLVRPIGDYRLFRAVYRLPSERQAGIRSLHPAFHASAETSATAACGYSRASLAADARSADPHGLGAGAPVWGACCGQPGGLRGEGR